MVIGLTIAFVVLKILGVIDWSWWWVVSPVWIAGIVMIICLVVGVKLVKKLW